MRDALPDADDRSRLTAARATAVIVGVGNDLRRDDAAGLHVVRLIRARRMAAGLAVREQPGDPLGLLEAWCGCEVAVVVDAMRCAGFDPGSIWRLDAGRAALPELRAGLASTHSAGVGRAIELARVLDRLPDRLIVLAVQGARFDPGPELSPSVRAALPLLAEAALAEALVNCPDPAGPLIRTGARHRVADAPPAGVGCDTPSRPPTSSISFSSL